MLHAVPDRICLQKLRGVNNIFKIRRIQINLLHIIHDLPVGAILPLMFFHNIREDIHILRVIRESLDRLPGGKGLEPEFRCIAEEVFAILGKRPVPMPHFPIVHVASVRTVRLIECSSRRRACRPVKGLRVVLL